MSSRNFTPEQKAHRAAYQKEWREKNKISLLDPAIAKAVREHLRDYHRAWRERNRDKLLEYLRKRHKESTFEQKAARAETQHKYYMENRDYLLARKRLLRQEGRYA